MEIKSTYSKTKYLVTVKWCVKKLTTKKKTAWPQNVSYFDTCHFSNKVSAPQFSVVILLAIWSLCNFLTFYGGGLGGICEITNFLPLVPHALRGHGFAFLSQNPTLWSFPAHCVNRDRQIKRGSLHKTIPRVQYRSKTVKQMYPDISSEKLPSTHIYRSSLHQPESRWNLRRWANPCKHQRDVLFLWRPMHYCSLTEREKWHKAAGHTMARVRCHFPTYLKQASIFLALFMTEPEDQRSDVLRLQGGHKI